MKIFSITLFSTSPRVNLLCGAYELSDVNFFQKSSVREFFVFFSSTFAERTPKGVRQSIEKESTFDFIYPVDRVGHVFTNLSGVSCVVLCDKEYPTRVAFGLINQLLDEFMNRFPAEQIMSGQELEFPEVEKYLIKYQNPSEADSIMRVQKELDDTKVVLHQTLESLLERGEKLDDLVSRSDQLGVHSKAFYKASKKTNSCCIIQ